MWLNFRRIYKSEKCYLGYIIRLKLFHESPNLIYFPNIYSANHIIRSRKILFYLMKRVNITLHIYSHFEFFLEMMEWKCFYKKDVESNHLTPQPSVIDKHFKFVPYSHATIFL